MGERPNHTLLGVLGGSLEAGTLVDLSVVADFDGYLLEHWSHIREAVCSDGGVLENALAVFNGGASRECEVVWESECFRLSIDRDRNKDSDRLIFGVSRLCDDAVVGAVTAFDKLPIPCCYKSASLNFSVCNEAFGEFYGVKSEEIRGHSVIEVFGDAGQVDFSKEEEALDRNEANSYRTLAVNAQMDLKELEVVNIPCREEEGDESSAVSGLMSVYFDRTEQSAKEKSLVLARKALDNVSDVIFLYDRNSMQIIDVNRRAERELGLSSEDLIGRRPESFFLQITDRTFGSDIEQNSGKILRSMAIRRDGTMFDAEVRISVMEESDDSLAVAVVSNIEDRLKNEEDLRRANRALTVANSFNETLFKAQNEESLAREMCDKFVSDLKISTCFIILQSTHDPDMSLIYNDKGCRVGFFDCLDQFGYNREDADFWLSLDVEDEVLLSSERKIDLVEDLMNAKSPRMGTMLSLSFNIGDKERGILLLFSRTKDAHDEADLAILRGLAQELGFGVLGIRQNEAKKEAEKSIATRLKIEGAISRFSSTLLSQLNFQDAVKKSLPILLKASSANYVVLYRNTSDGKSARKVCDFVRPGCRFKTEEQVELDDLGIWRTELEGGHSVSESGRAVRMEGASVFQAGPRESILVFPVFSKEEWVGFLGFVIPNRKRAKDEGGDKLFNVAAGLIGETLSRIESDKHMKMLAVAINSSDEGVVIVKYSQSLMESEIIFANEGISEISGYAPDELIGGTPSIFRSTTTDNDGEKQLERRLTEWRSSFDQVNCQKKDDTTYLAERYVYPVSSMDGFDGGHCIVVFRDITEKQEMETRLAFANKLESVGQLSAGLAHEINTPCQFIGDNLKFMQNSWNVLDPLIDEAFKGFDDERLRAINPKLNLRKLKRIRENIPEAIEDSCEGAERVSTIVKAMREFSHPGESMVAGDLNKCIETTVTVCRNEWKYVSELELDLDESIPPFPFYAGDFNQVILNLIVNGAHAIASKNKDGEIGKIKVSSRFEETKAVVSIEDSGCGIPEEIRKSVFDPFFTTKEVGVGTGQGLFMAHSIIEQKHGGRIWLESEVGVGSTFYVELPIGKGDDDAAII